MSLFRAEIVSCVVRSIGKPFGSHNIDGVFFLGQIIAYGLWIEMIDEQWIFVRSVLEMLRTPNTYLLMQQEFYILRYR